MTTPKIFDEFNDNYKEAKATYEEIVASEMEEQTLYNNQLHPDQERFPGKTRLQVFLENVNPNLPKLNRALLAQYIGRCVPTTIRRNQYVTVQYQKYQLPNPQVISLLSSYEVQAYYLPNEEGVEEVYLYQENQFLCECKRLKSFNRANAEWTEADKEIYQEQMHYIKQFDQYTKEKTAEKLSKVGTLSVEKKTQKVAASAPVVAYEEQKTTNYNAYQKTKTEMLNKALLDL